MGSGVGRVTGEAARPTLKSELGDIHVPGSESAAVLPWEHRVLGGHDLVPGPKPGDTALPGSPAKSTGPVSGVLGTSGLPWMP